MDERFERWPASVIVYYDGDCALCNWSVARCLARGVPPGVRFAPQNGELFRRLIDLRPDLAAVDSLVIQSLPAGDPDQAGAPADPAGEILVRSDAVVWLASRLRGPERWLALLPWVAPRAVLDWGYRQVAKNRQRVGRRLAECPVPTPEQRRYFLA
jgi:predicted DCC family thiol-disulfide oxidoreductase YuxK